MQHTTQIWDVEYVSNTLTVRPESGDILFELVFTPPSRIDLTRANLQYRDLTIQVGAEELRVTRATGQVRVFRGVTFVGQTALLLESQPPDGTVAYDFRTQEYRQAQEAKRGEQ
jgi:hypothetical protein